MKIGEVYFIREQDRSTGKLTENVKIGMVSKQGESSNRLKQHQTGNPRDLILHHVVVTPAPFWVENGLHQRLDGVRVRAEWHRLEDKDLENAIRLAEVLAGESFKHIPFIDEQERLKSCVSNGEILEATAESSEWHIRLSKAKAQLDRVNNLKDKYKEVISGMSQDEIEQAQQEDLFHIEHYTDIKFDLDGFTKKYPDLIEKFTVSETKIKQRLSPKYLDFEISEIDPSLESFSQEFLALCDRVSKRESEFGFLRELESDLQFRENVLSWEKEISTSHLATICGIASGIKDQLTWKRSEETTSSLDKDLLESSQSEQYNEFVTAELKTRKKTRKRARRTLTEND
jgi:hypothetical protein